MKKSILFILLLFVCFIFIGCKEEQNDDPNNNSNNQTESISVDETTIPEYIVIGTVEEELTKIKINYKKTDDSIESIPVTKDMISKADLEKLNNTGKIEVAVTYNNLTTKLTLNICSYLVQVVYPDNTPVGAGVSVQMCTEEYCLPAKKTSEKGLVANNVDDGKYIVHIDNIPAGYTYDSNAYTLTTKNRFVTVKLIKSYLINNGEGTGASPYVVTIGACNVTFEAEKTAGGKYFSFTPTESGTYNIRSMAMNALAIKLIDPYIMFLGKEIDLNNGDISGNPQSDINFLHSFEAIAGETYYFYVHITKVTVSETSEPLYPVTIEINIEKVEK